MTTQNERLRGLLKEARDRMSLHMETYFAQQQGTMFLTISLVERIDAALAEPDETCVEVTKLRDALALSEVDVALARTWCRICRTENRSNERSRDAHPHEARCPLARKDKP